VPGRDAAWLQAVYFRQRIFVMNKVSANPLLLTAFILGAASCSQEQPRTLITIADARINTAQSIDTGASGDSMGDILVFDQPLLDEHKKTVGRNSGTCIRTRVEHSHQCQWTLSFENGSVQVAGREFDQGASTLSIVGGTGWYAGISGEMLSVNNNDGTFTQTLRYWSRQTPPDGR
jgi:hypothetical protein